MPPARSNHAAVLGRVREILQRTCEQDGQGHNLQEVQRRKAYRAGINQALAVLDTATPPKTPRETADSR